MMPRTEASAPRRAFVVALAMRTLMPVSGICMLIIGVLSVTSFALVPIGEFAGTRQWTQVEARVERIGLHEHGPGLSWPFPLLELRYRYVFDGNDYVGDRFGFHGGIDSDVAQLRPLLSVRPGDNLTVWVDAADPRDALVDNSLNWALVAMSIPGLALCVVGVLMVIVGMLAWTERPDDPLPAPPETL